MKFRNDQIYYLDKFTYKQSQKTSVLISLNKVSDPPLSTTQEKYQLSFNLVYKQLPISFPDQDSNMSSEFNYINTIIIGM